MTNGGAKWGIRLEIDFGQGSFNVIAGSVNWRSRIQVYVSAMTQANIIEMISGQTSVLRLDRGDRLRVTSGLLEVNSAPRWLGEQMVACRSTHGTGSTHVISEWGYVSLSAVGSRCLFELTQDSQEATGSSLLRRWVAMLAPRSVGRALRRD